MIERYILHHGDNREVMRDMESDSIDSVICDPPYGINFMGKAWDNAAILAKAVTGVDYTKTRERSGSMHAGSYDVSLRGNQAFQEWSRIWAEEVFRILKPGGYLLSFSSPRTYHRMTSGIEDAGFEIRDQIMWLFGSGFPKSLNLKGEWQGWGTALKPAHEPIVIARKPFLGTVAENVQMYGTGGLHIDACRIQGREKTQSRGAKKTANIYSKISVDFLENAYPEQLGRWPANVIHDGSDEVMELFPDTKATGSGKVSGFRRGGASENAVGLAGVKNAADGFADSGSAARFFYCAKTSNKDRNDGLHETRNHHPTVKPTDLMRYLCRLVTPPNGTILDPFMGSGSTGKAAMLEDFRFIGIEMMDEYIPIAQARIRKAAEDARH